MENMPLPFEPTTVIERSFDHVQFYNFGSLLILWGLFMLIDVMRRRWA